MKRPLDTLLAKLKAGQNACWLGVGDSTYYGTVPGGWPRMFGKLVGERLGCIVRQQTSPSTSEVIYNPPTGGTGATLLLTNIGGPGTTFAVSRSQIDGNAKVFQSPNLASTPPDAVILWQGFNDVGGFFGFLKPAEVGPDANIIVDRVRSNFGNNPSIIVSTENAVQTALYNAAHAAMVGYFSDQSTLPLSPALIPGKSTFPNLWCIDSKQAFGLFGTNDTLGFSQWLVDGLHPNFDGYTKIAQWMFDQLVKDETPDTPTGSTPVITTVALKDVVRGKLFYQALKATPSGAAWSVTKGALPEGLSLNKDSGEINGTPTLYASTYSFTIRATNAANLYAEADFSGTIDRNVIPFNPTNTGKVNYRALGVFYSASAKIKSDSGFVPLVIRS